jgi:hypothetical protein
MLLNPFGELLPRDLARRPVEHQVFLFDDRRRELEAIQDQNASIAAWATRLLPSTNGWLSVNEKPTPPLWRAETSAAQSHRTWRGVARERIPRHRDLEL